MKIPVNTKQALLQHSRAAYAWSMKFNRKYVGPVSQTNQGGGVCALVFGGLDAPTM